MRGARRKVLALGGLGALRGLARGTERAEAADGDPLVLGVTNVATNATNLFTSGASSGFFAFRASNTLTGNGYFGEGGDSGSGSGGSGVRAHGGDSGSGTGGVGVSALGGLSNSGTGGDGVIAQGGDGQPASRGL